MATNAQMSHTKYLTALRAAKDCKALQQLALGSPVSNQDALDQAHEALLKEAEEAGDNKQYAPAAKAFRKDLALAWAMDDNRLLENVSAQALYYGALTDLDTLLENCLTVWAVWAHIVPGLKARDRARLQDLARFRTSLDLGVRERENGDSHISAAVSLLAPTFEKIGALNVRALDDKSANLDKAMVDLWEDLAKLVKQIDTSVAR